MLFQSSIGSVPNRFKPDTPTSGSSNSTLNSIKGLSSTFKKNNQPPSNTLKKNSWKDSSNTFPLNNNTKQIPNPLEKKIQDLMKKCSSSDFKNKVKSIIKSQKIEHQKKQLEIDNCSFYNIVKQLREICAGIKQIYAEMKAVFTFSKAIFQIQLKNLKNGLSLTSSNASDPIQPYNSQLFKSAYSPKKLKKNKNNSPNKNFEKRRVQKKNYLSIFPNQPTQEALLIISSASEPCFDLKRKQLKVTEMAQKYQQSIIQISMQNNQQSFQASGIFQQRSPKQKLLQWKNQKNVENHKTLKFDASNKTLKFDASNIKIQLSEQNIFVQRSEKSYRSSKQSQNPRIFRQNQKKIKKQMNNIQDILSRMRTLTQGSEDLQFYWNI